MSISILPVDLNILKKLLRLPNDCAVVSVETDPLDPTRCLLRLTGRVPPGEVTANYTYEHTTIVKFQGFEKVTRDQG